MPTSANNRNIKNGRRDYQLLKKVHSVKIILTHLRTPMYFNLCHLPAVFTVNFQFLCIITKFIDLLVELSSST